MCVFAIAALLGLGILALAMIVERYLETVSCRRGRVHTPGGRHLGAAGGVRG
jgi:hypothetical protein